MTVCERPDPVLFTPLFAAASRQRILHGDDPVDVVMSTSSFSFDVGSRRGFSTITRVWSVGGCCDYFDFIAVFEWNGVASIEYSSSMVVLSC